MVNGNLGKDMTLAMIGGLENEGILDSKKGKLLMSTKKYRIIKNSLGYLAEEIASHEKIFTSCKAMNALDENQIRVMEETINDKKTSLNKEKVNSSLPKNIYKFVSLDDNDKLNIEKFYSLEIDSIWFSCVDKLNDPYEFRTSSLSGIKTASNIFVGSPTGETLIPTRKSYEAFCREWDDIKKNIHVACFVDRANDNLPFWAHYAGNSRGFCLKYEIIDDIYLHKVKYVKSRTDATSMFHTFKQEYDEVEKLKNRIANGEDSLYEGEDLQQYIRWPFTRFILSHTTDEYITKHVSWIYEQEYRLLKQNDVEGSCGSLNGGLASASECGLRLKAVYIGKNCEVLHVDKLKEIARSKDVYLTKCEIDESNFFLFNDV